MLLSTFLIGIIFLLDKLANGFALEGLVPPPTVVLNRHWKIQDNQPIGTRIERARGRDSSGLQLTYSIKPSETNDGSKFFRINTSTGDIYLSNSLHGLIGSQYYLYVCASNGEYDSKVQILVDVIRGQSTIETQDILPGNGLYPPPPQSDRHPSIAAMITPPPSELLNIPPSLTFPLNEILSPIFNQFPPALNPSTETTPHNRSGVDLTVRTTSLPTHASELPEFVGQITVTVTRRILPVNDTDDVWSVLPPFDIFSNVPGDVDNSRKREEHNFTTNVIVPAIACLIVTPIVALMLWMLRQKCVNTASFVKVYCCFRKLRTREHNYPIRKPTTHSTATVETSLSLSSDGYARNSYSAPSVAPRRKGERTVSQNDSGWGSAEQAERWEFPRSRLKMYGILGEGCFGQVWRCEAYGLIEGTTSTIVAVKTLKENAMEREKRDLQSELEVLKVLEPHPNIVQLLGCCTETEPIFVIMEFVALGKLQSYLRNSRQDRFYGNLHGPSAHLTSQDLTMFAYQVAKGMDYLTAKGIIHRDLAARNVLVCEDKTCKVADFGFARDILGSNVYERKSEGRLPIRWMAPESLYDNLFSVKSDVWSFGVLLWEIVTLGSTPYPGMSASEVMRKVRDGYRLDKPAHCKRELFNIMHYCWDKSPVERPSFKELISTFEQLLLADVDYIELEQFPEHNYYNISSLSGEKV